MILRSTIKAVLNAFTHTAPNRNRLDHPWATLVYIFFLSEQCAVRGSVVRLALLTPIIIVVIIGMQSTNTHGRHGQDDHRRSWNHNSTRA